MEEPCGVKFSAFPIYRFFRNELPALTKAALVCVVLFGVLAFVIYSPGFSLRFSEKEISKVSSVNFTEGTTEAAIYQDSEPLFLPTRRNFGAEISPDALSLQEKSFLPFGELLSLDLNSAELSLPLRNEQIPPPAGSAFGADSWGIARGFASGIWGGKKNAAEEKKPCARLSITDAATGRTVYAGRLSTVEESDDDGQTLFAPAEYFCDVAFPTGKPRVFTVRSCGDAELDAKIAAETAEILRLHVRRSGVFRIFVAGF